MRPSPTALRHACALLSTVLLAALLVTAGGAPPARDIEATSGSTYLCSGYAGCRAEGFSDAGYGAVNDRMYWNMYPGHNCTNYVAYRMIRGGMSSKRPFGYPGNATNWGQHMSHLVDNTPRVGAVAWWRAHDNGSGSSGHVAYVERVTPDYIVISEDSWGGTFHWRRIDRGSYRWPTGFLHFIDRAVEVRQTPSIQGTPRVGETLSVTNGQWSPSNVELRYQWFVDGKRIVGARERTFSLRPEYAGKRVRVRVAARHPDLQNAQPYAAPTAPVAPGEIVEVERPTLSGTTAVGETLKLDTGEFTPKPDDVVIRWRADGETIPDARGTTLPVTEEYVGAHISARIVVQTDGYSKHPRVTPRVDWVRAGTVSVAEAGSLRGRPRVGWMLAAQPGVTEPTGGVDTSYQWLRDGAPIPGATDRRYRLTAEDFQHQVGVRIDHSHPNQYPASQEFTKAPRVRDGVQLSTRVGYRGQTGRGVLVIVDAAPARVDATVGGTVAVRFGGRTKVADLENGSARLVFPQVPYGTYSATVRLAREYPYYGAKRGFQVQVTR